MGATVPLLETEYMFPFSDTVILQQIHQCVTSNIIARITFYAEMKCLRKIKTCDFLC